MKNKKSGFTLIELLIVIAIIAIIAAVVFVALNPLQRFSSSRDTMRLSQVVQIKKALELYIMDNSVYPSPTQWSSGKIVSPNGVAYLATIPNAPTPPDGSCSSSSNAYVYTPSTTTNTYSLSFCLGSQVDKFSAGNNILTPTGIVSVVATSSSFACGSTIAYAGGPYDLSGSSRNQGGYYRTVQIGSQCWFKDNLNIGTMVIASSSDNVVSNNGIVEKYCYNNITSNCDIHGGLYSWGEAMQYSVTESAQGVCPTGWHIPSDSEQNTLDQYLKTVGQTCNPNRNTWDCYGAGIQYQDPLLFNALLSGVKIGASSGFTYFGNNSQFWSSTVISGTRAWDRLIELIGGYDDEGTWVETGHYILRTNDNNSYGYSVRCIHD
ncbi:MAG: fibrobacter succinogenes major paralogous domain-containing protein [Candidatus Falkowbacteria bacterium]